MVTTLRITSAILFFVSVHLIVPRVTNAAANLNNATVQNSSFKTKLNSPTLGSSTAPDFNLSDSNLKSAKSISNNGYEPPNYGGPDSEYASGTR